MPAAALRVEAFDALTLIFNRASGITHVVAPPVPEIMTALADEALSRDALVERLGAAFDLDLVSVSPEHCHSSPLPHPAAQNILPLGGRVGERAGADSAKLKTTLGDAADAALDARLEELASCGLIARQ